MVRLEDPSIERDRLATARQWIDAAAARVAVQQWHYLMPVFHVKPIPVRSAGLGHTVDWEAVRAPSLPVPTTLAGGLTPDNVATAIRTAHATAVNSQWCRIITRPEGSDLVRRFIESAKQAFSERDRA